jgi:hypothetical protein
MDQVFGTYTLANGKTAWPDGFDWRGAGVLMKGDE